jgi:hypothetical protein
MEDRKKEDNNKRSINTKEIRYPERKERRESKE